MPFTLEALRSFIQGHPGDVVDLSFIEPDRGAKKAAGLLSAELAKSLEVFGEHGSGSLLAFWSLPDGRRPIVWIDSEGSPNGVVAPDIAALASMLVYDTGLLYDLLNQAVNHAVAPEDYPPPPEREADWPERRKLARETHADIDALADWLEQQGLAVDGAPATTVWEAFRTHPRLDVLLVEKGLREPPVV